MSSSGCATGPRNVVVVKEPVCGTVEEWSDADQERAADEMLNLLPADSPITWALGSFIRMRDEARACEEGGDAVVTGRVEGGGDGRF